MSKIDRMILDMQDDKKIKKLIMTKISLILNKIIDHYVKKYL